jgi:hypothetical protein
MKQTNELQPFVTDYTSPLPARHYHQMTTFLRFFQQTNTPVNILAVL